MSQVLGAVEVAKIRSWLSPLPPNGWDGLECNGPWSQQLSTVVQSTRLVSEGLAWPVMGCVPARSSLDLVFCVLRSGSLQSLLSKFLVGPWCLPLFITHS